MQSLTQDMSILNNVLSILNAGQLTELKNELDVELATMKLKEGTEVHADAFEAGNAVHIVTEDGSRVPLPEGEYELEDGRRIVVNEQSQITEVKSASEADATEQPADQIESVTETEMAEEKKDEREKEKMMEEDEEKIITIVKKEVEAIKEEVMNYVRKEMEAYKKDEEKDAKKQEMAAQPKRLTPNPDKGANLRKPLEGVAAKGSQSIIDNVIAKINS